ncbi:hypothetical protein [Peribacillus frigoritolerans]|uniref:hypothetical protein n=1 Tax=Peribacillus frigoritolerans TaxID=450367 RepID=UPI002B243446|nr:hypothetical protein [Peribacillus frigoritolerans]MEB2628808.1 hypothetical protein [Peribacillus frigoritolerans]
MSAQQAMKLRMGKNLLYILIVYASGRPSGGINLTSSHMETDKDGVEYDGAYGGVSQIVGSAFIR